MQIAHFGAARQTLERSGYSLPNRPAYMLEHMRAAMTHLGNPQDTLRVIHVTGTSGKTSTAYFIASLLHQSGKKVGLSISPYMREMNERVQVNLLPLDERTFCAELGIFLEVMRNSDISLTRFEMLTAFMFWEFARQGVDFAVVEVGLGGELDATNVINRQSKVCVITDIGLDHQKQLGSNKPEIATKKSGIIGLGNRTFVVDQDPDVIDVFRERARSQHATLDVITPKDFAVDVDFLPLFQQRNFGLARAVIAHLEDQHDIARLGSVQIQRAAHVHIPGRMETFVVRGKTIILDSAHNPQKMAALRASLAQRYPGQSIAVLTAFKAKQSERVEQTTRELAGFARHIIVTTYGDPVSPNLHGEDPELISAMCKIHGLADVTPITNLNHAWRELLNRPEPILLVTGSIYLLKEMYPLLKQLYVD